MTPLDARPYCTQGLQLLWPEPRFSRCLGCGLRFGNPRSGADELSAMYADIWEDASSSTPGTGALTSALASQYVKHIISQLAEDNLSGRAVMDFGAGRGALIDVLTA